MERIIRVTGEGKVGVKPDTIELSFSVNEKDFNESVAMQKADDRIVKIKEAVKELGIEDNNVLTNNFSIRQVTKSVRDANGNYEYVFDGYNVNYSIKVSFAFDTALLGKALSKVSGVLENTNISINFTVKNDAGIKAKLLESAVENAKADAQILAKASRVNLGPILAINHSYNTIEINSHTRGEYAKASCFDCAEMSSFDDMNVGDIEFEATVNIDWAIM